MIRHLGVEAGTYNYVTSGVYQVNNTVSTRIPLMQNTDWVLLTAIGTNVSISVEEGITDVTAAVVLNSGSNLMMPVTGINALYAIGAGAGSIGVVQYTTRGMKQPIIKVVEQEKIGKVTQTVEIEPVMNIDMV